MTNEKDLSIDEILALPLTPNKDIEEKPNNKRHCKKCSGSGKIVIYSHVKAGKCFDCSGKGYHYI
jgi:DnaJ-class molecular chaperone